MTMINYLAKIIFETDATNQLAAEMGMLGIRKPLLVTDEGIMKIGLAEKILSCGTFTVYDKTPPNPTEKTVRDCMEKYRNNGCDGFVALGGGSSIDLAKAASLLLTHDGGFAEYEVARGGMARIGPTAPLIAIPTTAGTGSEVSMAAAIVTDDGQRHVAASTYLVPNTVICDPQLTLGLPAFLTAVTGIDALSHGIEAFLSPLENPPADAIALDCVARISRSIENAVRDGSNIDARYDMMMGALEGGMVMQKLLGAAHALSSPLGEFGYHHGTIIAIVLPEVLAFNEQKQGDKISRLKTAIGLDEKDSLGQWAKDLFSRLGVTEGLASLGVVEAQIDGLASLACKDHFTGTNYRQISKADYENILRSCMG